MNRYRAASLHFLASASVMLCVFVFMRLVWFPDALFDAAAGKDLMKILVLVDVILGPLVMLVIFNPAKKELKFDVAVVLLCQLAFLAYGVWSIYSARPVYLAFVENRFHLVTANQIEPERQARARISEFKTLPLLAPRLVGTQEPDDPKVKEEILFAGLDGMGLQNLPEYFVPYQQAVPAVLRAAHSAATMPGLVAEMRRQLQSYENEHPDARFVRLLNKRQVLYVAVNAKDGALMRIFN